MKTTIDGFAAALQDGMAKMAGPKLAMGPVEHLSAREIEADLSAHIALVGEKTICVILTANEPAALELVRSLAGIDTTLDDALTADAVGELLNVVVGMTQKGAGFQFGLPVIARGAKHKVRVATPAGYERVTAKTPRGEIGLFVVEGTVQATADN